VNDRVIGHALFVGGITRTVYLDAADKQYVEGDGERVIGAPPA
jgi:hypothetical protein